MKNTVCTYHQDLEKLNKPIQCWKIDSKDLYEEEDPWNMKAKDTTREHIVQDDPCTSTVPKFRETIKTNKNNIGTMQYGVTKHGHSR